MRGPRGARVHREAARDAEVGEGVVAQLDDLDRLHVELVTQDVEELRQSVRVRGGDGELAQRQADPQPGGFAHGEADGHRLADAVHRGDESLVFGEHAVVGPVLEVNAAAAGETLPDLFGDEREQRSRDPAHRLQHRVQSVEGLGALPRPEAVAAAPHVPVGENVREVAQGSGRERAVQVVEVGLHVDDELSRLGEQVPVEHVGRIGAPARGVTGR